MSFLILQTFPYLPLLFYLSPSIVLLPTPLLIFSVPVPPYLTPLPFPSSLSLPHVLPPPTDLPLSSFTLFPFPLHPSPSHPSPHILRSPPFAPHAPPIPLLPFTTSCPPPPTNLPYLPSLFFVSPTLLLFSILLLSHPTPLLQTFPYRSPSYPSPHILRSRPSIPYTPPISLLPFTASCPSSSYIPSPLLSPLPSYPSLVMPLRSPMPYFPHAFPFCSFSTRIQLCYYYC